MKKKIALFLAAVLFAPAAIAAEITPYVGLGIVVDKAGTSAKRVAFDATKVSDIENIYAAFKPNAGDDMGFDMAFAGEITAGVKIDNVRAELEVAIRSASEDDYEIYDGNLPKTGVPMIGALNIPTEIETSTSVRHNSYLANVYYDFELANSNWTPYIGAGVGFGVYHQKTTVEFDFDEDALMLGLAEIAGNMGAMGDMIMQGAAAQIPQELARYEVEMEVANDTLYRFEWQVGLGAVYNFNEDWALDIGYRFNSSTVADEFVYAHEIKIGARYSF